MIKALGAFCLFVAAGAGAQNNAPVQPVAAPDAVPAKKICQRLTPTGSIMPPRRVCWTPEQYARWKAQIAKGIDLFENRGQRAAPPE